MASRGRRSGSDTTWILQKFGSLGASTITWQATATPIAATPGLLIVNGIFRVENKGTAGATIGNIVVSLQKKAGNEWVTVASDVADATQDDNATTAHVQAKATDFTDRDVINGTSSLQYGDLYVCGLTTMPLFNGMTIRQVLAAMNASLGGGAADYSYDDLAALTADISTAFESGAPSSFAQDHVFATPCP